MGAVYRAEDVRDGRQVAVKLILPEAVANPTARARFLREAGVQAEIDSEYVVPVFEVGESDGAPFLVLPLLRGEPLEDRLIREPVAPLGVTLKVAREVAEGLAAADAKGIVHRDIKPSNIWLEGDPSAADPDARFRRCLILDFGLARATGVPLHQLTVNRELLGTPAYMSPERVNGEPVDGRTDLFSLGAVLYEMATGQQPFDSPNPFTAMMNVVRLDPPPARSLNPAVPEELSDLIARLVAKNPDDRPRSAREVADAVRAMPVPIDPLEETPVYSPPEVIPQPDREPETVTDRDLRPLPADAPVVPSAARNASDGRASARRLALRADGRERPRQPSDSPGRALRIAAAGVLLTAALIGVVAWAASRGDPPVNEVPEDIPSPSPGGRRTDPTGPGPHPGGRAVAGGACRTGRRRRLGRPAALRRSGVARRAPQGKVGRHPALVAPDPARHLLGALDPRTGWHAGVGRGLPRPHRRQPGRPDAGRGRTARTDGALRRVRVRSQTARATSRRDGRALHLPPRRIAPDRGERGRMTVWDVSQDAPRRRRTFTLSAAGLRQGCVHAGARDGRLRRRLDAGDQLS